MKTLFFAAFLAFSNIAFATELTISSAITDNSKMPFIERSSALALNVEYDDIKKLRAEISKALNLKLKFFDKWNHLGEAHVTTITPPEFTNQLVPYVTQEQINKIAEGLNIQASDVKVLGIGSGKKNFNGEQGETFFVIIKSKNLMKIRDAIYQEYLKNGGPASGDKAFKPLNFYGHITIGYTHEDIHESDGLLKDMEHSQDKRLELKIASPSINR